jgi:hypothetical protein
MTQKELYQPKTTPTIIDVPEMTFNAVDGKGDPNTRKMLEHICAFYRVEYDKVIFGTGEVPGILYFYQKNGFEITRRVPDFFTRYCDYPIIEDGVLLKDKIYLERTL